MRFWVYAKPIVGDQVWMNPRSGWCTVAKIDEEKQTVILAGGEVNDWEWPVRDIVETLRLVVRRNGVEGMYQCL